MSKPTSNVSRVVSLNGLGRNRSPGQRVLNECRDLLVEGLCKWLRDVAPAVSEELFVLLDSTRERLQQTRYLDLRADIEKDWQHFVETFRRNVSAEAERRQDEALDSSEKKNPALEIPDFEGLQLIDDHDLSQDIVIREFSAQLEETCNEELYTLNRRVAALLGQEDQTDASGNPLAPSVICHALSDSCSSIGSDPESRLILLRRLERHLHVSLPDIYQRINGYLIERGILPDLKRTFRRPPGASREASVSEQATPAATPPASDAASAPLTEGSILEVLQRLALARSALNPGSLSGQFNVKSAGIQAMPTRSGGEASLTTDAIDSASISQILLNSLNNLQHASPVPTGAAIVNQVRLVRDSDDAKQATGLEAVTMDIVAMLFDIIFDDARVPLAIKALLSRLQIPVLKVAMLNPGFFADRQHPTRRFLGCISGIAVRWGDSVDENDPFYAKLSGLVERIQAEFEQDIGVFGTALDELEGFVNAREEEENDTALVAANTVIRHEIEAEAWERAQQAVRTFLRETPQPAPVDSFLDEHWAAVLRKIAASEDNTAETDWRMACDVMKDLAWSIIPKKAPDDRLKLIGLLPRLLASLNKGLDSIDITAEQRSAFFDALVKKHSAALKGESPVVESEAPQNETEESAPTITPPSEGDLLVTRSVDNGVQVEEIVLVGAAPVWKADDRDIARQVDVLKRGDWVEFIDEEGRTNRERLNWISPQRGILLFSNHRSSKAISITPEALVRQIRDGRAALVHEEALFERALSGALESINGG